VVGREAVGVLVRAICVKVGGLLLFAKVGNLVRVSTVGGRVNDGGSVLRTLGVGERVSGGGGRYCVGALENPGRKTCAVGAVGGTIVTTGVGAGEPRPSSATTVPSAANSSNNAMVLMSKLCRE